MSFPNLFLVGSHIIDLDEVKYIEREQVLDGFQVYFKDGDTTLIKVSPEKKDEIWGTLVSTILLKRVGI